MWKNIAIIILSALLISMFFNRNSTSIEDNVEQIEAEETDSTKHTAPKVRDSVVVRYVTARQPIVEDNVPKIPESVPNSQDSVGNMGENVPDSTDVVIPITQKLYEDSTYRAYVSGYNASLDSIYIFERRKIVAAKPRRWQFGVQAGVGLTPKGVQPYIGIGVQYNFVSQ